VYSFSDVFLSLSFSTVASDILYHVTLKVVKAIGMNIFYWLDATIFVMISPNLLG
jgi:hypothetical protein